MCKDLRFIKIDKSVEISNCYVQEPKNRRSYLILKRKLNSCEKRSSPQKPETLDLVIRAWDTLQRHKNKQH